jgi:hypothetical protein
MADHILMGNKGWHSGRIHPTRPLSGLPQQPFSRHLIPVAVASIVKLAKMGNTDNIPWLLKKIGMLSKLTKVFTRRPIDVA